jgi:putative RecB family exonuclease
MPSRTSLAALKGRFVHKVMEYLFQLPADERTLEAARSFLDHSYDEEFTAELISQLANQPSPDLLRRTMLAEADVMLRSYFDGGVGEDPTAVIARGTETLVEETVNGVPLRGIIDRLDQVGDHLEIVDYKTGKVPKSPTTDSTFTNAQIYAILCEERFSERPKSIRLLYLAHNTTLPCEVTNESVDLQIANVTDAWADILRRFEANSWDPSTTVAPWQCRWCDFRTHCPAPRG